MGGSGGGREWRWEGVEVGGSGGGREWRWRGVEIVVREEGSAWSVGEHFNFGRGGTCNSPLYPQYRL